ncbi:MAG: four helix bundle protein [Armatimonadetes bacterium]|nr:four helix bundle protein [Armatimonadota bacterium]
MPDRPIIPPHGGYRGLEVFKLAEIIYDGTVAFCRRCVDPKSRTKDQMVQAARSGKQNIAEGSQFSATSKKIELKLMGVARASLEELLLDYEDFLRQKSLELWPKDHEKALFIRSLAMRKDKSYSTYRTYIEEKSEESSANTLICLIHQASYLLDQLLRRLERDFAEEGGFTERLHKARTQHRSSQSDHPHSQ